MYYVEELFLHIYIRSAVWCSQSPITLYNSMLFTGHTEINYILVTISKYVETLASTNTLTKQNQPQGKLFKCVECFIFLLLQTLI